MPVCGVIYGRRHSHGYSLLCDYLAKARVNSRALNAWGACRNGHNIMIHQSPKPRFELNDA